jgi:GntR family transcriptional regulator
MVGNQMIPRYFRIASLLRNKILSGQHEPGERLPTADEMAEQFAVSKITIRTALSRLQAEGLIKSMRAKGSFVSESVPVPKQFIVTGRVFNIVQDAERYEVKAFEVQSTKVGETRICKDIQNFLGLSNGDEIAFSRRIRLLKGVPIWFLENFFTQDIGKYLTKRDLSKKPLLKILKEKAGIKVGRGEMYLEAVPAESDVAEFLNCQAYDPLFHIQVYYWLSSGEPLELANAYLRAEYFKYKIDLDPEGFENI